MEMYTVLGEATQSGHLEVSNWSRQLFNYSIKHSVIYAMLGEVSTSRSRGKMYSK